MNYDRILHISCKPLGSLFNELKQKQKWWGVMVWPEVIGNSALEVLLLVIGCTLSYIEDPVLSLVPLLQESRHITGRVSISAFEACGWVTHGNDLWGYVS